MAFTTALTQLASLWRRRVSGAGRAAALALCVCTLFAGAHLARLGTAPARIVTALLLLAALGVLVFRAYRERRAAWTPRRTIERVLTAADPEIGARAERALNLLETTRDDDSRGSAELAALHMARVVARATPQLVERSAERRARWLRWLGFGLAAVALAAVFSGPMRVVEGLDVMLARAGRAPLPLPWLDIARVNSEPPSYLRQSSRLLFPGAESSQPQGSLLTFRGAPLREGRQLVLTDGESEVPFVSDGSGGVVARWTLEKSVELRVAARFGEVLIEEPETLALQAIEDSPPEVELKDAPKSVELRHVDRLELHYAVGDDHGLRQIDLVLRAGEREDRRVLSRLDGESTAESGGYVLNSRDPFLRRMFLPVLVTIEARDNDPMHGPKWGKSKVITLIPPAVGEPEADRYSALSGAQNTVVDLLAWQLTTPTDAEKKNRASDERKRAVKAADGIRLAVDESYGGLSVPAGLRAFLLGQARLLEQAPRPGASSVRKTEEVLLAIDVVLKAVGTRDARTVSKRLADVAEEAALAAKLARESEKREAALIRLDASLTALGSGIEQLSRLGVLGADIGSVATADLGRVERSRKRDDLTHTELAARHLAARLRRPNPSFGAAMRGGVESGGGGGIAQGSASEADDRYNQLARELAELVEEHSGEISGVERALAEAEQGVDLEHLKAEAKQRAESLREALGELPMVGSEPGSARASGAVGREHGQAMAQSLERLSLADAVESGKSALSALKETEAKLKQPRSPGDWLDDDTVRDAREELEKQLAWAERELKSLKQSAAAKAQAALKRSSDREQKFAQRSGNLAGRGKDGETALPEDAVENLERAGSVMREAARALADGRGERGLELQREAQRLLERASSGQTSDPGDEGGEDRPGGKNEGGREIRTGGEVPGTGNGEDAQEFRRRVLEGLARDSNGRMAPAVKRYAEGLLR